MMLLLAETRRDKHKNFQHLTHDSLGARDAAHDLLNNMRPVVIVSG